MLEKCKTDPVSRLDTNQSQNLIDWSLVEVLSFHKIWFKSVNNFLRYPGNRQTDRQTDKGYHRLTVTPRKLVGGVIRITTLQMYRFVRKQDR